jgi:hypothetical protein
MDRVPGISFGWSRKCEGERAGRLSSCGIITPTILNDIIIIQIAQKGYGFVEIPQSPWTIGRPY